jgi:hypothetical protein
MKVNLRLTKFLEEASTTGQMASFTRANGRRIKCMAMELSFGKMAKSMKVNSSMISEKEMELLPGLMEDNTLDPGSKESNTDKVPTFRRKDRKNMVNGIMEEKFSGLNELCASMNLYLL